MAQTACEVLVDVLHDWGVDVIFGLPGDGIDGMMEALRKNQDKIRFVQVRHEEAAAFMACGYAKHTGKLGVCMATSGPGAVHLLNGLYDAKFDGQPVLAITGMQFHDLTNTHQQQDLEVDKLFMDVADYNVRIMGPDHMEPAAELACRTALARHSVSSITIPVDFQEAQVNTSRRSKRNVPRHTSETWAEGAGLAPESSVAKAAEILNAGRKIVLLAGRGALHATDELEQMAEKLGAVIVKPLLGKAVVPDDSPYTTGGVGLLGTKPSADALRDCDTLVIIGSGFPYIEFLPKPGQARCIQIELFADRIGLRYPVDVGLVGDSRRCLQQLMRLLKRNEDRGFLKQAQAGMLDWWKLMDKRANSSAIPMKPQLVAAELSKRLDSSSIVNCDSGTITTWWARHIRAQRGQKHTVSGSLASMACGVPYALASQIAYPDRQCVAFVGDGGFTMLMGEMATAVQHQLPIKVFIIKNNALGQIKWEQMVFGGNPEFGVSLKPNIDFGKFAEACGAAGFRIEDPKLCGETIERALAHPGPAVVECLVDENEPPLPPNITADQALHFAEALARGDQHRGEILKTIVGGKIRELV